MALVSCSFAGDKMKGECKRLFKEKEENGEARKCDKNVVVLLVPREIPGDMWFKVRVFFCMGDLASCNIL